MTTTERGFLVRLRARSDEYRAEMRKARRETEAFQTSSTRSLDKLGRDMQDFGKKATTRVTLPIVGIGGAAVAANAQFDAAMSKIVGLVGIAADEVDAMKGSVLDLAGRTATAPQELADALFVVTSAGLRGANAMDTLEAAAMASAAGLGTTEDIARAVAGAVNAYGADVLDAASATDILTATARAGNFETSQLAGALGRVLPFAQQAQASFEDVGGAVALLTRTNGNAAESITQVQALMRAFVVPTAEANKILGDLNLTAGEIRDSIGENGLVATLQMLDGELGGNREQLGKLLGSSEAASAAFQILNADAETLQGTFGTTANAAGMVGEAFGAAADTDAFRMKQAMTDIKVALIEIGGIIGPFVADLAGGLSTVTGEFAELDPWIQKVVIGIALLAAAGGPAVFVLGGLVRNLKSLRGAMSSLAGASGTAKTALVGVGIAVTAAAVLYGRYNSRKQEAIQLAQDFKTALDQEREGIEGASSELIAANIAGAEFAELQERLGVSASDLARFIRGEQVPAIQDLVDLRNDARSTSWGEFFNPLDPIVPKEIENYSEAVVDAAGELEKLRKGHAEGKAESERYAAALQDLGVETATDEQEDLTAAVEGTTEELDALIAAAEEVALASDDATVAAEELAEAERQLEARVRATADAMIEQAETILAAVDARRAAADATFALRDAEDSHADTIARANEVLADNESTERDRIQVLDDVAKSAAAVADSQVRIAEETANMNGTTLSARQGLDLFNRSLLDQAAAADGPTREAILNYIGAVNGIPPLKVSEILALIDEGKLSEAQLALNQASEARTATITADALTADAEAELATLARTRLASIVASVRANVETVTGAFPWGFGDTGGYLPAGTIVAERGPEFVNGGLVSSPSMLLSTANVTGRAGTRGILSSMASSAAGGSAAASTPPSVRVYIGDRELTDIVRVEVDSADAGAADAIRGGLR